MHKMKEQFTQFYLQVFTVSTFCHTTQIKSIAQFFPNIDQQRSLSQMLTQSDAIWFLTVGVHKGLCVCAFTISWRLQLLQQWPPQTLINV